MTEFWESHYKEIQSLWGFKPADSAIYATSLFLKNKAKEILIPGIGYGRNAKNFCDNEFNVTGIEISETAIKLAQAKNNLNIKIHHGSVTNMPFDAKKYDGIYCYALIHLLNFNERRKLIRDCYTQLSSNGIMVFVAGSKKMPMYCQGSLLSKDRYKIQKGLKVFSMMLNRQKKNSKNMV